MLLGGTVVPGGGAFANISRSSWKGVNMGEMYNGDYIDWEEGAHFVSESNLIYKIFPRMEGFDHDI